MPRLIFRAPNERSNSLSQTSSQAAITPSRGCLLGIRVGAIVHLTSRLFCVCASVSVNSSTRRSTRLLAHPNLALPAWFSLCRMRQEERGAAASATGSSQVLFRFLDLRKDFYNPLGFFSFTGILGTF